MSILIKILKERSNAAFLNFIWDKSDRVERVTIGNIEDDGVGLVKLKVIKTSWVKRIVDESYMLYNIFQGI